MENQKGLGNGLCYYVYHSVIHTKTAYSNAKDNIYFVIIFFTIVPK